MMRNLGYLGTDFKIPLKNPKKKILSFWYSGLVLEGNTPSDG